jgi:hypothetical protein
MIALILCLSGIRFFIGEHPWFGGLCWLMARVVLFFSAM